MPSKRPDPSKGGGISPALLKRAIDALKDPRLIDQILEHRVSIIDAAKRWLASITDGVDQLGDRFGQKGLERRASNLQETVSALSIDSPALAQTLRPVTETLNEVGLMLKVSANLPFAKRKKAHRRIDKVLDVLETGLMEAPLRDGPSDRET